MKQAVAMLEKPKKVRALHYVYEATYQVAIDGKLETVKQLFAAKDFQGAFFKQRKWAKANVFDDGRLVSLAQNDGMVI